MKELVKHDPLYLKKRPTQRQIEIYVEGFLDTLTCAEILKCSWIFREAALELLLECNGDIQKALSTAKNKH